MLINKVNHCFFSVYCLTSNLNFLCLLKISDAFGGSSYSFSAKDSWSMQVLLLKYYINDVNDWPIVYVLVINSVHFDIDFTKYVE